jgi:hypothetical protein
MSSHSETYLERFQRLTDAPTAQQSSGLLGFIFIPPAIEITKR